MKFEVNEKVFAFTMLLFGQQLFLQMFNSDYKKEDDEFKTIQPVIKKLYEGMAEEHRKKSDKKALKFKGSSPPILKDFTDVWYIMYCISNYRVDWVGIDPVAADVQELNILKYALINVAKKSHKEFPEFRSRHI